MRRGIGWGEFGTKSRGNAARRRGSNPEPELTERPTWSLARIQSLFERVEQGHGRALEIRHIARHHRQVVNQRGRRDLLVQLVRRKRHPQPAPDLSRFDVERQDPVGVLLQDLTKPPLQQCRLRGVTPIPDEFDPSTQFAYCHR